MGAYKQANAITIKTTRDNALEVCLARPPQPSIDRCSADFIFRARVVVVVMDVVVVMVIVLYRRSSVRRWPLTADRSL